MSTGERPCKKEVIQSSSVRHHAILHNTFTTDLVLQMNALYDAQQELISVKLQYKRNLK